MLHVLAEEPCPSSHQHVAGEKATPVRRPRPGGLMEKASPSTYWSINRDNGKENGNCYNGLYWGYIGV